MQGRGRWIRLHEKGGKEHDVPCHHRLDQYLHDCLETAGIGDDVGGQESPEWAGMHEAVSAGIRNMPDHIASLIPFVRRKRLAGRLVKNPTIIPSCIMNQ